MRNIILIMAIIATCIISCRRVHIYEGSARIIKTLADSSLKDSAEIFGHVISAEDKKTPEIRAMIWIEETNISSNSDNNGYFEMKVKSGTYTIKCKREYGSEEWTEVLKDVKLQQGWKTEVEFILGNKIE